MSKGRYKIEAIRYHESLPAGVLPLVLGKNKAPWGYKFENNLGKTTPSGDYETLMKNFVIAQIRADPERTRVSLELCLEDLELARIEMKERPSDSQRQNCCNVQGDGCCGPEMDEHTSKEY